jgi:hypothetical protein
MLPAPRRASAANSRYNLGAVQARRPSHRTRYFAALSLAGGLVLGCGSRAGAPPQAPTAESGKGSILDQGPPFVAPGERMTFRVSAHGVTVATFAIAAGQVTDVENRRAIVVQAGASTAGLVALVKPVTMQLTSWIDIATGQPLLFRATESAGPEDDTVEQSEARLVDLEGGVFPITTVRPDTGEQVEQQVAQGTPLDFPTVLLGLRRWEGQRGEQRTIEALRSRFLWRIQLTVGPRETIVTELGQLPAIRFDAMSWRLMRDGTIDKGSEARRWSVWISDDADRVPIRLVARTDYGDIEMAIVDYGTGSAPNLADQAR